MRRRAKRDLMLLLGIVVTLVVIVFINSQGQRLKLAKRMVALRLQEEAKTRERGFELLDWKWVQDTEGSARTGAEFDPKLEYYDGKPVNIMGFMTPLERFRDMKEFILLPMPIECYFCERPPMRDKIIVKMAEGKTEDLLEGPVLFNGILELQRGAGVKFFYGLNDAESILDPDDPPELRIMDPKHMAGAEQHTQNELQEGIAPPTGENLDLDAIEETLRERQQ